MANVCNLPAFCAWLNRWIQTIAILLVAILCVLAGIAVIWFRE